MTAQITAAHLEQISKVLRDTERKLTAIIGYNVTVGYETGIIRNKSVTDLYRQIKATACEHFGISLHSLEGNSRRTPSVWGRYICIKLMSELQKVTLKDLGKQFGGRDHSTIISALERFNELMEENEAFKESYEKIYQTLKPILT